MFATITARRTRRAERRVLRTVPGRCDFLENAAMCREMHRL